MPNKREESTTLAEFASTEHRGQMSAEPIVGILISRCSNDYFNSDAINKEKSGVWQTPATTKKKEPACLDGNQAGIPRNRRGNSILYFISIIATVL